MFAKLIVWILCFLFFLGCQSSKIRPDAHPVGSPHKDTERKAPLGEVSEAAKDDTKGSTDSSTTPSTPEASEIAPSTPPPPVLHDIPKIGLILGPGGARAFAHIAVLHEFQKEKIPIHSISGLEFGAPMAALFAWKGFANDVEWQMMKLKPELFQKPWLEPQRTSDFLNLVFQKLKAEELRLPFACLSHNLSKSQLFVMRRGSLQQLLPYCWPYPPLMKPHLSNISGLRDPKLLADHLRSQGADYIVFVNVLGGKQSQPFLGQPDSFENIVWQEIASSVSKSPPGIDYVIQLNLDGYGLQAFDKRREIVQKGAELGATAVRALARKLNL